MSDRDSGSHDYWPLATPFLIALSIIVLAVGILVGVGVIAYAYRRVGLDWEWMVGLLVGSIVGSRFNIRVARFPDRTEVQDTEVQVFGVRYRIPTTVHTGTTTLAVNVGGALIPTGLATYLAEHDDLWLHGLIAIACLSVVMRLVAQPVAGVGIVAPTFLPPIAAAVVAYAIGGHAIAALAYIGGTMGTLIGADLLNLGRIRDLGAPVASIGGAGTFDGIFLTGIFAVLLASL